MPHDKRVCVRGSRIAGTIGNPQGNYFSKKVHKKMKMKIKAQKLARRKNKEKIVTNDEIINEWCAVLKEHGLYVSPVRFDDLRVILQKIRLDTEYWKEKGYYK